MATFETSRPAPLGAEATLHVVNFFENSIASIQAWNASRKTVKSLNALSTRQLEDIGIQRANIPAVAANMAANRF